MKNAKRTAKVEMFSDFLRMRCRDLYCHGGGLSQAHPSAYLYVYHI